MKHPLKKTLTLLSVYYAYMLEYRSELILWILSGSLPIILMGVWIKAAEGGKFSITSIDFARYFFAVFLVRQMTVVWVIFDFEREVIEGKLSPRLLQPIDPGFHHLATHVAERFARMPFVFLLIGFFFLLYPQAFWLPSLPNLLLFTLAAILAFALRFLIQYTFAMFSFWTERATALESFWFLFFLFLSGMIAPLEVFPETVRNVVMFTPFPYLIHFPASILVGLPVDLTRGFLSILGWLLVFLGANRLLWRAGLKRYSGMGA
ncbi:ABC-2 family transporter protein [Anabaena cylindrica UHCC 0172]|uniref:ABC transporter permease n=1 Tax=Anabaena cylindrica TaxID=1165 RepID=UPI002B21DB4D|nr:ABC-2 family transporter protein [Anabaena cylindrica]MEA5551269.1 ABC-2 family transporter protein [Anabaena cylindrica UHCC 0172]